MTRVDVWATVRVNLDGTELFVTVPPGAVVCAVLLMKPTDD